MIPSLRFDAIDVASLPRINPIFRDYLRGKLPIREFYRWDPRETHDQLLQSLRRRTYARDELAAILTDQNQAWGAGEEVLESITRLRDSQAVSVVTGQQVGLFGGPLYTLYKALTTLQVARQVELQWHVPCLPLFWMASEDGDFGEIDHLYMPGHEDQVTRVRYSPDEGFGPDLPATHALTPKIEETLAFLEQASRPTAPPEQVFTLLKECYRPGTNMVSAFGRLLSTLLGKRGLILVDPSDPRLKALSRPLFLHEVSTAPTSARLVRAAGEKLRRLGYAPQVRLRGEGPNLFYLAAEGRRPLRKEDAAQLPHLVEEAPERLSPNVVFRPLMESFLFPAVAHVGGPNEIAYYAQLKEAFEHFDIPMPVLLPRATLTLIEGRIERLIKKHNLSLPVLHQDPERVVSDVLRRSLPRPFVAKQQRTLQAILKNFAELKELVATLDPTLTPRVGRAEGLVKKQIGEMERLLLRSLKRRHHEVRIQILRVLAHVLPNRELQERMYGFVPYLCRHDLALIDLIAAAIDGPGWEHRLLYLGAPRGA